MQDNTSGNTRPKLTYPSTGTVESSGELLRLYDILEAHILLAESEPSLIDSKALDEFIQGYAAASLALLEALGDALAPTCGANDFAPEVVQTAIEELIGRSAAAITTFASYVDRATESMLYLEDFPRLVGSYQCNSWNDVVIFKNEATRRTREIAWLAPKMAMAQLIRKDKGIGSDILTTHADALKWFDHGWTREEAAETLYRMLMDEVANEFLSGIKRYYGG